MRVDYNKLNSTLTIEIDDIEDLLGVEVAPCYRDSHVSVRRYHDRKCPGLGSDFWGQDFPTHKHIEDAAYGAGWPNGVRKLRSIIDDLDLQVRGIGRRRRKHFADFGDDVDMQRVYAGNLDRAWDSFKMVEDTTRPKAITIAVGVMGNHRVEPEQFFWRGATALLIADALTTAGISVRIIGYSHTEKVWKHGPRITRRQWVVKDHGQPLDLDRLTLMLCSGGFARHYSFKIDEARYVWEDDKIARGYGRALHRDWWGEVENESVIQIKEIWSEAQCLQYIADLMRREDIGKVFIREEMRTWSIG